MWHLMNLPLTQDIFETFGDEENIKKMCKQCGCDGIEYVWGGEDIVFPNLEQEVQGWHLTFCTDWLDFWNENKMELNRKFGSPRIWEDFYGGNSKEILLQKYQKDIALALTQNPAYVVYHVSDVSIEETYSYKWLHRDEEVIDKAAEFINKVLDGKNYTFQLLVENLQWPGFKFTDPRLTQRLLERIHYKNKGIMLDIGHLLCTNHEIKNQEEGIAFIHEMLDAHGELCKEIKGIHLHQSISGEYVKKQIKEMPSLPIDYKERFIKSYSHIQKIDGHQPWENAKINEIVERIKPTYVVHEIMAKQKEEKIKKTIQQRELIQ